MLGSDVGVARREGCDEAVMNPDEVTMMLR